MGLKDYTRIFLGDLEIGTAYWGEVQILGLDPVVPGRLADTAWDVATGAAVVTISALPNSGGAAITGFVGRLDGGAAVDVGVGLGDHVLSGLVPGAVISIRIAAVNAVGQGPWSISRTVTVQTAVVMPPTVWMVPTIIGTATVGQTLMATEGIWMGTPTVALQWLRSGMEISGARGLSYVLTLDDLAANITVRATATNAGGSVTSTSAAFGPVVAAEVWFVTAGERMITVTSSPASPSTAVVASTGDGTITLAA